MSRPIRQFTITLTILALLMGAITPAATAGTDAAPVLLTDPFLQSPTKNSVRVVWLTEFAGRHHVVVVGERADELNRAELRAAATGGKIRGVRVFRAATGELSRVAEDAASQIPNPPAQITRRHIWRHEATVRGLGVGSRTPYRVVSIDRGALVASDTYTLAPAAAKGHAQKILLTSDHQSMPNTPANLQKAVETVGRIDAVFLAGDLVNVPDRASEWFDDQRGGAFFPALQGRASRTVNGVAWTGGEILQHAPLFPAIGNHEVQGRSGLPTLNESFNAPVPREVAEAAYRKVARQVNPRNDPKIKERWILENSFNTETYEEIFSLPTSGPGGERWYATTVGDVRLISLYATRIWRGTGIAADPANWQRTRYTEAPATLGDPLAQGWGSHIFEQIGVGGRQYKWLQREVASRQFRDAKYTVVMLHEGPHGLGDNVSPPFTDPVRTEETDAAGNTLVRYDYPRAENVLTRDVAPLLESAGVNLVLNGHSHLWNRFTADSGTHYLETSNVGNSYGAFHPLSGRSRPIPPAPWDPDNYLAQGNPGGLAPQLPTVAPLTDPAGTPLPFVQSNDYSVFSVLDTGTGEVTSYRYDMRTPDVAPVVLDRFALGA
ncbi:MULTISPECIES: metallophosphoesterase family protein [unclassified Solwaraspora]|uniref:metallophosphoesterase family protein n=1 Tax=unclassified Solwaraspora TaxID=2627926 RepID=UPI00259B28C6|nr:metallophosphoesterase [Solwaraspora sp. WMMA2056]WJK38835.1 metallophosphoesterase [Solwaraspora sp. WMMA2056]